MVGSRLEERSVEELVAAYAHAAREHGRATELGDPAAANEQHDAVAAVYRELRRCGTEARRALLPLLGESDLALSGWAAAHALEFARADRERVLSALAVTEGIHGFNAELVLDTWREGTLVFP
jgi:hypothetical protein